MTGGTLYFDKQIIKTSIKDSRNYWYAQFIINIIGGNLPKKPISNSQNSYENIFKLIH
jgi:hypothetical protein